MNRGCSTCWREKENRHSSLWSLWLSHTWSMTPGLIARVNWSRFDPPNYGIQLCKRVTFNTVWSKLSGSAWGVGPYHSCAADTLHHSSQYQIQLLRKTHYYQTESKTTIYILQDHQHYPSVIIKRISVISFPFMWSIQPQAQSVSTTTRRETWKQSLEPLPWKW